MKDKYDLIVVGGGVLGTFHAYHAKLSGLKVAILEKDQSPQGATVRNFGQVVPSGMNTKWQVYGRESLKIYKDIQSKFDISIRQEGSVYLASNYEEVELLEELAEINKSNNYSSKLITKNECLNKYSGLREDYVQAGLFFPEEVIVEPLVMINKLHAFLIEDGMDLFFNAKVVHCDETVNGVIMTLATGSVFIASKVIICNGSDFKTLYPSIFEESDLVVSKLQMMATKPQQNYSLKGSILTGLSIRRYEAFEECASYSVIKANENKETLEKKWGVHVLFKQAHDGSIILGDSHEYANASEMDNLGFGLNMDIDNFIIHEAKKIIDLPNYEIQRRWFGMYSQCKNSDMYQNTIGTNIHIITGIGGKGMTGSAGFSKQNINTIFNL
ncbi:MAG: FAD dependent oxidoreductase TIGR03364 [Mariniflexile sp.]|jgi:FAD dependent oxidoreductase TIGR03364